MMTNETLFFIHLIIVCAGWIPLLIACIVLFDEYDLEVTIGQIIAIICAVFYIFSIVFLFVGIGKLDKQSWNYSSTPYATEKIVSLSDSNQINGKFHLRRGYIGEKLYYKYMVDLGSGGYKANKVGADNTILFYDDDTCRVEWYEKERHWLYFSETEKYQKIYVPEGSITDDYMIDLQ